MIASVFSRAGMIESWGRGIEKITETCIKAGKSAPIFDFKHGREFSVTFYSDASITINITTNDAQKRILAIMTEKPSVTVRYIANELGIADRNVKNHIKALKDAGVIDRIGATKNGHWIVKKSNT